jgi:iron complex outermembrane recepter protein
VEPTASRYNEWFPGGFTPEFGAELEDISGTVGLRGEFANGVLYDFSTSLARNEVGFYLNNTVNPSMGPDSPRASMQANTSRPSRTTTPTSACPLRWMRSHSPLNVAWGLEYRSETFEIRQGEEESWAAGPFAFQSTIHIPAT